MDPLKNTGEQKIDKQFGLTTLALKNKTTVFVLTLIIVLLGVISYVSMPKESFPEVEIPTIYIGTPYPGNSPADIENLVTRPIEKEVNTITEVDNIRSTSVQDYSTIIIEFRTGTDVNNALTKVKDAVDKAKSSLPTDLPEDPNVFELNFSEFPILNVNLSGNYELEELNDYAEYLKDEFENLPEISKADIRGVDEKEVRVTVDPYKMEARELNFGDIENAISAENVNLSGGNILTNGIRRSIRVLGEFDDPIQLQDIVISNEKGNIVYLKDVAQVSFDYKEKESYARLNGNPVVMVDIVKRSGENLLIATDKIYDIIDDAQGDYFPSDLEVFITNDQSDMTRMQVNNLENSIIFGVILVVLVLLFFLGTRNSLFVGVAIPLSMFMAFMILSAFGITINMMVLFSLIMALGMLVDNGIVVVENVYRLMEDGYSPFKAAKLGVGEVALPIISSTATTLAAFLPLAFWPGMMGEFMGYLPITLIITLGSSLFVALVINPVLIATYMKVEGKVKVNHVKVLKRFLVLAIIGGGLLFAGVNAIGNLLIFFALLIPFNLYVLTPLSRLFQSTLLPWLEKIYENTVTYAVTGRGPYLFLGGTLLLLVISIGLLGAFAPNVLFFPENQPKYVNVFVELPIGTDIEETNEFALTVENRIFETINPYMGIVESVVANVGSGTSDPNDPSSVGQSATPNKARITINFVEFNERGGQSTAEVMNNVRDALLGYPGVTITVDKDAVGPPVGKPINIEIAGKDFETLIELSDQARTMISESGIQGIERLRTDLETGKPELIVDIDREKARRYGLSTYSVASEIRTALFGKEVSKYKQGEDDYEIQVRLADQYRYDLETLMNKNVTFRNNSDGKIYQVPISSVAKAEFGSTYGSVKRKDLDRVVTIFSNVLDGYNPTEINDELKVLLADLDMPKGYELRFTGEQESQAEEMAFLSQALLLAVFMIFLIIVSQFNKLTAPIIIMTSVLFSTIGVFLGLVIFQMDFIIIMTMIGIISLAGIVVNNAIVLIDFIELIRKRKREELGTDERLSMDDIRWSIIQAGKTRLRPVLLTAITTILGLLPLALGLNIDFLQFLNSYNADFYMGGDNAAFWGPMSWTIIFGLTFATFLTLVIVPVMYLLTDKLNLRLGIGK